MRLVSESHGGHLDRTTPQLQRALHYVEEISKLNKNEGPIQSFVSKPSAPSEVKEGC
jgi:hypothetical protein